MCTGDVRPADGRRWDPMPQNRGGSVRWSAVVILHPALRHRGQARPTAARVGRESPGQAGRVRRWGHRARSIGPALRAGLGRLAARAVLEHPRGRPVRPRWVVVRRSSQRVQARQPVPVPHTVAGRAGHSMPAHSARGGHVPGRSASPRPCQPAGMRSSPTGTGSKQGDSWLGLSLALRHIGVKGALQRLVRYQTRSNGPLSMHASSQRRKSCPFVTISLFSQLARVARIGGVVAVGSPY